MASPSATGGYCPACGTPLVGQVVDHRPRRVCPACGRIHWRNAKPCAGALVVRNGKVLLVRRAVEPFLGYWDIPGGFCEADEHPTATAIREVREETGLEIELTGLLGLWLDDYVPADPAEGDGNPTLNIYYLARPLTHPVRAGDDADGMAWFAPKALPRRIAFVNGREALATWAKGDATPLHLRGAPLPQA
jgi:8-oxo-dGTP diphosphatase